MSRRRNHYNRSGGRKISYPSYEAAVAACERRRATIGHLEPYLCHKGEDCGWHIGRREPNEQGRLLWAYEWPYDDLELGERVGMNLKLENRGKPGERRKRLKQRGRRAGTGRESIGRHRSPEKRRAAGSPRLALVVVTAGHVPGPSHEPAVRTEVPGRS